MNYHTLVQLQKFITWTLVGSRVLIMIAGIVWYFGGSRDEE